MTGSPGPTESMLARQVRMGDVLFIENEPHAVIRVVWLDSINGEPLSIGLELSGGITLHDVPPDAPLDVVRPFDRHAETGPHDEPS